MELTAAVKGLTTKQAFAEMLDNPDCVLKDKKVLRFRMNNDQVSLNKMINILKDNGYKIIQDQVWIRK